MGFGSSVGKYDLGRTIGEGTSAKVKQGINRENGQFVAIKIIDKRIVMENNLMYQVKREIKTMKLLHHPNIVRIHEVLGTKTKIYIVMEYVSGGQLLDKMSYAKRLNESEARKYFQQLIDALHYCHGRGVYHRDLKPENLLLDNKGNVKVSDFGLSALRKPGALLSTACGSPCYVAPELLANKGYDGAAADVWSCGVILFELLAGHLPFDDRNLMNLYKKISRADYTFPKWFTEKQKKLISGILNPNPITRMTLCEIIEDEWFQMEYEPAKRIDFNEVINLDDVHAAFDGIEENTQETKMPKSPSFINAFQLIAMSNDLDLSGLFEEQDEDKQKTKLGSKHNVTETIRKIEAAAKDVSLSIERMKNSKTQNAYQMKIHPNQPINRCSRSYCDLSAQVIEVAPTHCVVEVSKSAGELGVYNEFCRSLLSLLKDRSGVITEAQEPQQVSNNSKNVQDTVRCTQREMSNNTDLRGYSSS